MDNFIGLNIKTLCLLHNLSQKDFGNLFDIKQSTISTYLAGRSNPQIETIQKICEYFKITIDELINIDLAQNDNHSNKNKTNITSKKNAHQIGNRIVGNHNKSDFSGNTVSNSELELLKQKLEFVERENVLLRELLAEHKKNKNS
ncbi:helix-turn-helix transcriptional regulator [Flavobacterium aestivum]|uniref:helix-turn-helix transcriptional regulator n=1 Tax=Flavobacterium aestivum TaxID=3003257 RepID=UPI002482FC61|nr:helix-turn-helix transcriptional regulator [Flavobacterium aestivum]